MNNPDIVLEPWLLSLGERMELLRKAKEEGRKIAVYYAKAPDSTTFRYRVYNVYQITRSSKKWQAVYFYRDELEAIKEVMPMADLFIYSRQSRWDNVIDQLRRCAKKHHIPVLFDLDDLVFDKKYLDTVMNVIGERDNYAFWVPYFDGIAETAKRCDGFLATNEFLGEKLNSEFDKPCRVIRNSINEEQLSASDVYVRFKSKQGENFSIGYFSGTPTHANDLAVALPEIVSFLYDYPDAVFKIVGFMDFDQRVAELVTQQRIVFLPVVDFRKLQRRMSEVDVNIAPLVKSVFTDCKSELKFFEAAAVETTTIASPTYTFARAIKDGENGYLANAGEWYDKLEYLYKHPKKNREVALTAKEYVLKNYCGIEFLREVEEAYDYFAR